MNRTDHEVVFPPVGIDKSLDVMGDALVEIDLRATQHHQLTGKLLPHTVDLFQIGVGTIVAIPHIRRLVVDVVGERDLRHAGRNGGAARVLHRHDTIDRICAVDVIIEHAIHPCLPPLPCRPL